jgi:GNAT superfamily N-acetyltransferase
MGSSTKPKLFTLSEDIRPQDYMVIATIGHDAFLHDVQTNLKKFNLPEEPISDEDIRHRLAHPESCSVIKAVSTGTNEIMGLVCWAHRGYIPREPRPEETRGAFTDKTDEIQTKIHQLEKLSDGHFVQFMTDIMPEGTKCWFIAGLNVAPKYQGMGVGRALIEWGTSRAEKDGVFAWVHSSAMAWEAYQACGFEIVRELRLDLDEYAEGEAVGQGPLEDGKWGIYIFRYMVYAPERALGLVGK